MSRNNVDRIYESVRKINHAYEIWAVSHGLTVYEMEIYYVILKKEKAVITQKDLCMELAAPKTSINSIIKKQLKAGYIEMHVNPQNKREKVLSLTDSGQAFAEALILPLFRHEEEAVAVLDDREVEAVITAQNKFADVLLDKIQQKKD